MRADIQELLIDIKKRLPEATRNEFSNRIRVRANEINSIIDLNPTTVAVWTAAGAAFGGLLDLVPGLETLTGVDGFVDVGTAIGAFVGVCKSEQERRARNEVRRIIVEELNALQIPP